MSAVPTPDVYLAPDFNPATLKVAQLRGILYEHSIPVPSASKKADLVSLFQTHIKLKADEYFERAASVQPSVEGIREVGNDGVEMTPPPPPGKRSRKSVKPQPSSSIAEVENAALAVQKRARRVTRSHTPLTATSAVLDSPPVPASKAAVEIESQQLEQPSSTHSSKQSSKPRPSRAKVAAAPTQTDISETIEPQQIAAVPTVTPRTSRKSESSAYFSDYNPFQSGAEDDDVGSGTRRKSTKTKRKTIGGEKREPELKMVSPPQHDSSPLRSSPLAKSPLFGLQEPSSPTVLTSTANGAPGQRKSSRKSSLRYIQPDASVMRSPPDEWRKSRLSDQQQSPSGVAPEDEVDVDITTQELQDPQPFSSDIEQTDDEREVEHRLVSRRSSSKALTKRPTANSVSGETSIKTTVLFSLLAMLVWAYNYQRSSLSLGYCDTNSSSNSIIKAKHNRINQAEMCVADRREWANENPEIAKSQPWPTCEFEHELPILGTEFLPRSSQCAACPAHAECSDGKIMHCQGEYILEPSLLNPLNTILNGLPGVGPVAFPPTCELDIKTRAQVAEIAKAVEAWLAMKKGQAVCSGVGSPGGHSDRAGSDGEKWGVSEEEIFSMFSKRSKLSPEQFRKNLNKAIDDLVVHKNIIRDLFNDQPVYSAVRAEMPLACRMRLAVKDKIIDHQQTIGLGALGLAIAAYLKSWYERKQDQDAQVKRLVKIALARLQDQQYTHYVDAVQAPEPFLRPNQLRDFCLEHIHNSQTRQKVWARVQPVIETNANVKVSEQEVGGDTWKIWEWIGVSKMDAQYMGDAEGPIYA